MKVRIVVRSRKFDPEKLPHGSLFLAGDRLAMRVRLDNFPSLKALTLDDPPGWWINLPDDCQPFDGVAQITND